MKLSFVDYMKHTFCEVEIKGNKFYCLAHKKTLAQLSKNDIQMMTTVLEEGKLFNRKSCNKGEKSVA